MPIGGGKDFPDAVARAGWVAECARLTGIPPARVEDLLRRYGTRARAIAASLGKDTRLGSLPDYSREELEWLIRNERVGTLDDLLYRRTAIAISGSLTPQTYQEIARIYTDCLNDATEFRPAPPTEAVNEVAATVGGARSRAM